MDHTILLMQATRNSDTRTYADYITFNDCMDGICKIYEEYVKDVNPHVPQIYYDVGHIFQFIDQLPGLSCLVYEDTNKAYRPRYKPYIKEKLYTVLANQSEKQNAEMQALQTHQDQNSQSQSSIDQQQASKTLNNQQQALHAMQPLQPVVNNQETSRQVTILQSFSLRQDTNRSPNTTYSQPHNDSQSPDQPNFQHQWSLQQLPKITVTFQKPVIQSPGQPQILRNLRINNAVSQESADLRKTEQGPQKTVTVTSSSDQPVNESHSQPVYESRCQPVYKSHFQPQTLINNAPKRVDSEPRNQSQSADQPNSEQQILQQQYSQETVKPLPASRRQAIHSFSPSQKVFTRKRALSRNHTQTADDPNSEQPILPNNIQRTETITSAFNQLVIQPSSQLQTVRKRAPGISYPQQSNHSQNLDQPNANHQTPRQQARISQNTLNRQVNQSRSRRLTLRNRAPKRALPFNQSQSAYHQTLQEPGFRNLAKQSSSASEMLLPNQTIQSQVPEIKRNKFSQPAPPTYKGIPIWQEGFW